MKIEKNTSIWKKILAFIKKFFNKKDILLIDSKENKNAIKENKAFDFQNQYNIIKLQNDYENGKNIDNFTNEEKDKLIELYKSQITVLENNILVKKNKLKIYKDEILKLKEKYQIKNQNV